MRKILTIGLCSLALTGCSLSPGQNLDTADAVQTSAPAMPMVKPTIIPINGYNIHHVSQYHSCVANHGRWLCDDKNHYDT